MSEHDNDQVFDLRPMKSERINFADRISALEAENSALKQAMRQQQEHDVAKAVTVGMSEAYKDPVGYLVSTVNELTAERDAARAWAAVWKRRAKAHRDNSKHLDREADALYKSCNEDRAWAAAWREAAHVWRGRYAAALVITPGRLALSSLRRRDARRAAEAMER